jgi:HlyD family secretion protein
MQVLEIARSAPRRAAAPLACVGATHPCKYAKERDSGAGSNIFSRMIKNWMVAVVGAVGGLGGCDRDDVSDGRHQGMVEHEEVAVGFTVGGRVAEILVVPGQEVAKGAPIARLDDAVEREGRAVRVREVAIAQADLDLVAAGARGEDIRAAAAQLVAARAAETSAGRERERTRTLVARGALGGAALDELDARVAATTAERQSLEQRLMALRRGARGEELARARARVALATEALALEDARLAERTVVAPAAGTVLDVLLEPGELVLPPAPVALLVDPRRPYADVFVPVADIPAISVGTAAHVAVDGLPGETAATVERIFPRAEFTPRFVFSPRERPSLMVRVRVRIADPDGHLHAGLPAFVRFSDTPGEAP